MSETAYAPPPVASTGPPVDNPWCVCCGQATHGAAWCGSCGVPQQGPDIERLRACIAERMALAGYLTEARSRLEQLDRFIPQLRAAVWREAHQPMAGQGASSLATGDRELVPQAGAAVPVKAGSAALPAPAVDVTAANDAAPTGDGGTSNPRTPVAASSVTAATRRSRSLPSPRTVLTWTGCILLALAAVAFAAWAWTAVGQIGRFAMLLGATGIVASISSAVRRRTPVTAESLDVLTLMLLAVDWAVLPLAIAVGARASDWYLLGLIVIGAVALVIARVHRSVLIPHLGVVMVGAGTSGLVLAQALRSISAEASAAGSPMVLWLALAAAVPLVPLALGLVTARWWRRTWVTAFVLGCVGWALITPWVTVTAVQFALPGSVDGFALAVALLPLPLAPVLALRLLPSRGRTAPWTALLGVAAGLGGVLLLAPAVVEARRLLMPRPDAAVSVFGHVPGSATMPGFFLWLAVGLAVCSIVVAIGLLRLAPAQPARSGATAALLASAGLLAMAGEAAAWWDVLLAPPWPSWDQSLTSVAVAGLLALPAVGLAVVARHWHVVPLTIVASAAVASAAVLTLVAGCLGGADSVTPLAWSGAALVAWATAVALAWRRTGPRVVPMSATAVAAAALLGLQALRWTTADLPGRPGIVLLLILAALGLVTWRIAAGTWLLPRSLAPVPAGGAVVVLVSTVAVLLSIWAALDVSLVLAGAAALLTWLLSGRATPRWDGVHSGALVAFLAVVAPVSLAGAARLVGASTWSGWPAAAAAWAMVATGLLVASDLLLAARGPNRRPAEWLPIRIDLPGTTPARAGRAALVSAAVAVLLLATAPGLPAAVTSAALLLAATGAWLALAWWPAARPWAAVLAVAAGLTGVGWSWSYPWGPAIASAVVALGAAIAAMRLGSVQRPITPSLLGPSSPDRDAAWAGLGARATAAFGCLAALGLAGWRAAAILPLGWATLAAATVASLLWVALSRGPWQRSGLGIGSAAASLVAAGVPALTGLSWVVSVPAAGLAHPAPDAFWAAVGGWTLLALLGVAASAQAAVGRSLPPLPRELMTAASYRLVAVACLTAAAFVAATGSQAPAWVPATVLIVAALLLWVSVAALAGHPRGARGAMVAALGVTVLAVGWVAPIPSGPALLALGVALAAGVAAGMARTPDVAATCAAVAGCGVVCFAPLALVAGGMVAYGSAPWAIALATGGALLLAAAPSLPAGRAREAGGVQPLREIAGAVGGVALAAAALQAPGAPSLGIVLAIAAAGTLAAGRTQRTRLLRYVGLALAVAATWVFVSQAPGAPLEAWTLPAAVALGIAGLLGAREPGRRPVLHPSWLTTGPALLVLVLPSAVLLLGGWAPIWRIALLAVVGAAGLALGLGRHEQAPTILGAVALAAVAVQALRPVAALTPVWVLLALAGGLLTWIGFTWERRRDQARHAAESWGRFA